MTKDAARPRSEPAWTAHPGAMVTLLAANPGEVRTDTNGVQWWFDSERGWQPVVHAHEAARTQRAPQMEAGA